MAKEKSQLYEVLSAVLTDEIEKRSQQVKFARSLVSGARLLWDGLFRRETKHRGGCGLSL
jgi:hypothetical protein